MVFAPLCAALRQFTKPPERNTWLSHLWLEHFYILIISLAEDSYLGSIFKKQCALLQFNFLSVFISFESTTIPFEQRIQKFKKTLCVYISLIIFYMYCLCAYLAQFQVTLSLQCRLKRRGWKCGNSYVQVKGTWDEIFRFPCFFIDMHFFLNSFRISLRTERDNSSLKLILCCGQQR